MGDDARSKAKAASAQKQRSQQRGRPSIQRRKSGDIRPRRRSSNRKSGDPTKLRASVPQPPAAPPQALPAQQYAQQQPAMQQPGHYAPPPQQYQAQPTQQAVQQQQYQAPPLQQQYQAPPQQSVVQQQHYPPQQQVPNPQSMQAQRLQERLHHAPGEATPPHVETKEEKKARKKAEKKKLKKEKKKGAKSFIKSGIKTVALNPGKFVVKTATKGTKKVAGAAMKGVETVVVGGVQYATGTTPKEKDKTVITKKELQEYVDGKPQLWLILEANIQKAEGMCKLICMRVITELVSGSFGQEARDARIRKKDLAKFERKYVEDPKGSEEYFHRCMFASFDTDQNGILNGKETEDFVDAFYKSGSVVQGNHMLPEQSDLISMIRKHYNEDGDGQFTFKQIQKIIKESGKKQVTGDSTQEMAPFVDPAAQPGEPQQATGPEAELQIMTREEMKTAIKNKQKKTRSNSFTKLEKSLEKSLKKHKHRTSGVPLAEHESLKAKFKSINTMNRRYEQRVAQLNLEIMSLEETIQIKDNEITTLRQKLQDIAVQRTAVANAPHETLDQKREKKRQLEQRQLEQRASQPMSPVNEAAAMTQQEEQQEQQIHQQQAYKQPKVAQHQQQQQPVGQQKQQQQPAAKQQQAAPPPAVANTTDEILAKKRERKRQLEQRMNRQTAPADVAPVVVQQEQQEQQPVAQQRQSLPVPQQQAPPRPAGPEHVANIIAFAQSEIESNDVVVFSNSWCEDSLKTKELFASFDVDIKVHELDLMGDDGVALQQALLQLTGQDTIPNIFVKGQHMGGSDYIHAAADEGELHAMLGLEEEW